MKATEKVKVLKRWTKNQEKQIIETLEKRKFLEVINPLDFPEKLHWKQMINSQIDQIIEFTKEKFSKIEIK